MNMRNLFGAASCSLVALSILVQPALAQVPNPGAGWVLVKQRQVRTFAANPAKPGAGAWQLIDVKNRSYFVEDGKATRQVSSTRKESQEISLGQSAKLYGDEAIQTRKKGEASQGDVANSRSSYYDKDYLISYKLTRYSLFEDVTGYKPWKIFNRAAVQTRDVNYYLVEWTDPMTNESLSELDPTPSYTDWVVGAPFDKSIASSGNENFSRRDSLGTEDRRVILGQIYSPQVSLADAANKPQAAKVGSFLSNKGEGNAQVALTGSKLRTVMGANEAVASQAKQAKTGGSIQDDRGPSANAAATSHVANSHEANSQEGNSQEDNSQAAHAAAAAPSMIDKISGTWQLAGGSKSKIKFHRAGKSENVKVNAKLDVTGAPDFDDDFTTAFSKSMSHSKGLRTLALQFNEDGTKLYVKLGLIRATFVKE